MFTKKIAAAIVLSAATALPSLALAAPPPAPAHCVLSEHRVTSVKPLQVIEHYGRGSSGRLVGATVLVQAEPGLTAEWLQLTLQRHMAQVGAMGMESCALDMKDVRVSVASAGAGFAVNITASNAAQAKEILRRAQLLVG